MKYANLFYFRTLNSIGGIESWYYYISKLYEKYDITLVCQQADYKQLERLRKRIRVIIWNGKEQFECESLFVNFNREILDYCKADKVYFFAHGNYEDMIARKQLNKETVMEMANDNRITNRIGISEAVCKAWKNVTGQDMTCCYNPISLDEPNKYIRLCAAQRLSKEKGGERIEKLISELNKYCDRTHNYYQLDIYTDNTTIVQRNNVTIKKPDININTIYGYYDWFISVTDEEGYCYSAVEALMRGTPVIATPCKVFNEIGLNETNSIRFEFDCSNVSQVVNDIFTKELKFSYKPPKSNLDDLLIKKEKTYGGITMVRIKAMQDYLDAQLNRTITDGEEYDVTEERAEIICNAGFAVKVKMPEEWKAFNEPTIAEQEILTDVGMPVGTKPEMIKEKVKRNGRKK